MSGQFHLERGAARSPASAWPSASSTRSASPALSALFAGTSPFGWEALPTLVVRALVGAALRARRARGWAAALETLQDGDARRREVRFDTRRPVL